MGGDWSSVTSMESGSDHSGPPEPSKMCLKCKKIQRKSMYTPKGWEGNGLCEPCRNDYALQKYQIRQDAQMAEQKTKVVGSAESGLEIPEAYNKEFGTSEEGKPAGRKQSKSAKHKRKAPTLTGKPEKRPYVRTKACEICGTPHHFRKKCPTASPAEIKWAVPGKDYPDPTPDMDFDRGMPGAWAGRSPRRKRVATLTSSSMLQGPPNTPAETTQRPWMASSAPDGLQGLREVVKASSEVVEPNYVHKHHKVPRTSIDLGIQCRIPPECIVSTEDGDFTVISFVPKGETRIAIPRDIN